MVDYIKKESTAVDELEYLKYPCHIHSPKPYLCPVCHGKGLVPFTFYLSNMAIVIDNAAMVTCRSCNGAGVLWG